jgi:selenocysteine lyase/cysteine desulfurase
LILGYLRTNSRVRIIEDIGDMKVTHEGYIPNSNQQRIPIASFVHETIPSSDIVEHCRNHGVVCRSCKFLSTDKLWDEMNLTQYDGVVRFSLAHYNSVSDITRTIDVLEMLDKWR